MPVVTVSRLPVPPELEARRVCKCGADAETSLPTGAKEGPKYKPVCRKCAAKARLANLLDDAE